MTSLPSQCNRITSNKQLQLGVAIFCQSVKIGTFSDPHLTFLPVTKQKEWFIKDSECICFLTKHLLCTYWWDKEKPEIGSKKAPVTKKLWTPSIFCHAFYYCKLTIFAHKSMQTIPKCKMDTAQIDLVTPHWYVVWIMRFSCSLTHRKHIHITDFLKSWLSMI